MGTYFAGAGIGVFQTVEQKVEIFHWYSSAGFWDFGRNRLVAERVLEIRFSGTHNRPKNGIKASSTRLFFIFYQFFAIFDDFSKWSSVPNVLSNFEKSWNMAKNEEKPYSTCGNQISGTPTHSTTIWFELKKTDSHVHMTLPHWNTGLVRKPKLHTE